jgi:electron transport complex protein RnfC
MDRGDMGKFSGGVHPGDWKELTSGQPTVEMPLPPEIVVHLHQHTGAPCRPLVSKGDRVLAGQKIGDAEAFVTAPVHSPVSGVVAALEPRPHFTGVRLPAVVITPDGAQESVRLEHPASSGTPTPEEIRRLVREAGIVGLGGAAFPTHVKLSPPKEKPIDTVLINGCECEPFLTCDHRNMLEQADRLLDGVRLLLTAVGASRATIGVEENKPDAIRHLSSLAGGGVEVRALPTVYPQGAEKQLVQALLGRVIPSGKLPMDVGALVQNVGTAIAVSEAVRDGLPLIRRTVTISGSGIRSPRNLRVPVGTSLAFVVEQCGGLVEDVVKVIMGGPMTGFAQFNLEAPVVKGTSGILALRARDTFRDEILHRPCIRCGRCLEACPMILMPSALGQYARLEDWEAVERFNVMDCIECGCCGYVCPARIPLVQLFKLGKAKVIAARQAKAKKT